MSHFSAEIAAACKVTVVADPDGLLLDDTVAAALTKDSFDVVLYGDPLEFRYYYESRHRARWDSGEHSSIVVSAPVAKHDLGIIPHDVLTMARANRRIFSISLAQLFPTLSCDVLADLNRTDLDAIWQLASTLDSTPQGQNQTRDLVLRAVFKLSADMVTSATDLLTQLIRLHQNERNVPKTFADRYAETLATRGLFYDWPIVELVVSSDEFYAFLQERWPRYLQALGAEPDTAGLAVPGPKHIDFGAPEISSAVSDLFVIGRLRPVEVKTPDAFAQRWEQVGIRGISKAGSASGAKQAIQAPLESMPADDAPARAWMGFAMRWGELSQLVVNLDAACREDIDCAWRAAQDTVDRLFLSWLNDKYGTLVNRAFLPSPTMVHHVPHFLAHRQKPGNKVALIVIDGMSIAQWITIKHAAGDALRKSYRLIESATFAWVPTITSVSRQAIFSGQPPMFFEPSVHSTTTEEKHWKAFWEGRGWRRDRVALIKHRANEPESGLLARVRAAVEDANVECIAVAINSIDRMIHGAGPDENVLNAAIDTWARNQHLSNLISVCTGGGHTVVMTADHGNVHAKGIGRPNVGSIPDDRGCRALSFPSKETLEDTRTSVNGTMRWNGVGLPESMHVLIPERREAFVNQAGTVCTHGGASIDEVLVPFVQISKL